MTRAERTSIAKGLKERNLCIVEVLANGQFLAVAMNVLVREMEESGAAYTQIDDASLRERAFELCWQAARYIAEREDHFFKMHILVRDVPLGRPSRRDRCRLWCAHVSSAFVWTSQCTIA